MRTSSNPVFRNLDKEYATFGGPGTRTAQQGGPGYGQPGQPQYGQQPQQYGYGQQPSAAEPQRAMTIDDVVTKTAMTLGVLTVTAIISYVLVDRGRKVVETVNGLEVSYPLMAPLAFGGMIVGFILAMIGIFTRKTDRPALVLAYAAAEGLFLGAISFAFANLSFGGGQAPGNAIIIQAVVGTFGVFGGMLVVYKTGAIRVTPKFTRMLVGALFGVLALMVVNLIAGFFTAGGLGLRDGGPIAIIFSLVCIALAAMSFLVDFDEADKLIRAGAPAKAGWSVAFGLTVTLVWLYLEILRLLSYVQSK
ncbi:Bax inhibitor-1/YccA family membrane protein [Speluncibacter jeojiensis]|uniref:Bax inhibitor-1/YccA family protein n=1 Tax=Speluncibacter jeojiensis TaxID=2710754 RepID=A0A9X4M0T3_9ACTN|nr:Bax inhibitor-1/YccA family protein [Corynebacteriales bacterium D3-21]